MVGFEKAHAAFDVLLFVVIQENTDGSQFMRRHDLKAEIVREGPVFRSALATCC
jgi:hypothetical protein